MKTHILQHQQKENPKQTHSAKKVETEKPLERISDTHQCFPIIGGGAPAVSPFTSNHIQFLQRTIGNQAVGQLIQAKLKIGQPNDKYEQEADRVADMVMSMAEPTVQTKPT